MKPPLKISPPSAEEPRRNLRDEPKGFHVGLFDDDPELVKREAQRPYVASSTSVDTFCSVVPEIEGEY
jgi:hypothetical protein